MCAEGAGGAGGAAGAARGAGGRGSRRARRPHESAAGGTGSALPRLGVDDGVAMVLFNILLRYTFKKPQWYTSDCKRDGCGFDFHLGV